METTFAPRVRSSRRPARSLVAAVVLTALTFAVAGCGLRLETEPPAPLVPDATEIARSSVADAVASVRDVASELVARAEAPDAADWHTTVTRAREFSVEHLKALGDSDPQGAATASTTGSTPEPTATGAGAGAADLASIATPALINQLGASLSDVYDAARTSIPTVSGEFSRLLASIAASDLALAHSLAGQSAALVPEMPVPAIPARPTPDPSDVELKKWLPVVAAEDQAGFGLETFAAQLADGARQQAVAAALAHRASGQLWSDALGLADTTADPRLPLYAVPQVLGADAAFAACAPLETSLAAVYGELVYALPPKDRLAAADGLANATMASLTWGAASAAFPGLS